MAAASFVLSRGERTKYKDNVKTPKAHQGDVLIVSGPISECTAQLMRLPFCILKVKPRPGSYF